MGIKYRDSGATMPETAITIIVFLMIVLGGMQLIILAYHSIALQFMATRAAREVALNHCQTRQHPHTECRGDYPGDVTSNKDRRAWHAFRTMVEQGKIWGAELKTRGDGAPMPDTEYTKARIVPLNPQDRGSGEFVGLNPGAGLMLVDIRRKEEMLFGTLIPLPDVWLRGVAIAQVEPEAK